MISKKVSIIVSAAVLSISLIIFLLMSYHLSIFTMDDSFISFRYASHLSNGAGLVWNVGESPPNEGYTSILWVLVVTVFFKLGVEPVSASKILGVLVILASASLIFLTVYRFTLQQLSRRVALLSASIASSFFLVSPELSTHAVSGMETALSILLHTMFFVGVALYVEKPATCTGLTIGALGLLCGLNRPEFNLIVIITLLVALYVSRNRKSLLYGGLLYVMCGALYFGWRLTYFELFFPLPYYIKHSNHEKLFRGFWPVLNFLAYLLPLSPLAIYLALGFRYFKYRQWLPAFIGIVANIVYFVFPAHIMGLNFRFLYPIYPTIVIFAGLGLSTLSLLLFQRKHLLLLLVLGISILCYGTHFKRWKEVERSNYGYGLALENTHIAFGKALATIDSPSTHRRTIALGDNGAIPFYSRWHAIDTYGLNNRNIAIARSKSSYSPELVLTQQPDILVLISYEKDTFTTYDRYRLELLKSAYEAGYRRIGVLRFHEQYYLWLMVRDASFADKIRSQLKLQLPVFYPS